LEASICCPLFKHAAAALSQIVCRAGSEKKEVPVADLVLPHSFFLPPFPSCPLYHFSVLGSSPPSAPRGSGAAL